MAIRTISELLTSLQGIIGDSTDDTALSFIEDTTDTLNDYEQKTHDNTDWKQKYEENDRAWRDKYRNRFFSSNEQDKEQEQEEQKPKRTFDDLFSNN